MELKDFTELPKTQPPLELNHSRVEPLNVANTQAESIAIRTSHNFIRLCQR
jgi:hypothetical protein